MRHTSVSRIRCVATVASGIGQRDQHGRVGEKLNHGTICVAMKEHSNQLFCLQDHYIIVPYYINLWFYHMSKFNTEFQLGNF